MLYLVTYTYIDKKNRKGRWFHIYWNKTEQEVDILLEKKMERNEYREAFINIITLFYGN